MLYFVVRVGVYLLALTLTLWLLPGIHVDVEGIIEMPIDQLAAELAAGDGPPRVYRVEPTGTLEDDPNVTDKKFPGNPTRSYRTREPLRVVEEIQGFERPDPYLVRGMRARMGELAELGIEAMDD